MTQQIIHAVPPVVVGVDVGGTKIAASLVDAKGRLFGHIRYPTDISGPEATLDSIAYTVNKVIHEVGISRGDVQAVGLGIPGLVDPYNGIGIASVNLNWNNVPVKEGLETRLGFPCSIENDVKAAALGETRYGAGIGKQNLVFMTIGTGVAAAVILEKKLYRGSNGMAGEIGHTVIEQSGPLCKCGGHGCLEALVSGPAIAARAAKKIQSGRPTILNNISGKRVKELTARAVFSAAARGDAVALETIKEVSQYLAIAIQFMALAYDPQVIVLGGGVPQAGKPFLDPVLLSLDRLAKESWVIRKIFTPRFVQVTKLRTDIGVLGAAALVATN